MRNTGTAASTGDAQLSKDPLGLFADDVSTAAGTSALDPAFTADPLGLFQDDAPQVKPA